jgi:ribosomal protein S18 acetylase RimI-like enzyme
MKRTGSRPSIRIRPCRAADIPRVLELWARAAAGQSVTDTADAIRLRLRRDRQLFLLAWDVSARSRNRRGGPVGPRKGAKADLRLVGSLIGGWDGWRATMARLAIDPEYRRHGIARQLVRAVEKELRDLGALRVGCVVFRSNRLGRAFWSSIDYTFQPEDVRYVKDLRSAFRA